MKTNKKYDFIREIYQQGSYLLHRIIAVCNFRQCQKGNLGGWIEKEVNLSHNGNGWVYDGKVYGNAVTKNNGRICGDAKVYDDSKFYDK